MNDATVWSIFCNTYEALYELLGEFDSWYAQNGAAVAIPSLQDEWKEFTQAVLQSMVRNANFSFDWMYSNKR